MASTLCKFSFLPEDVFVILNNEKKVLYAYKGTYLNPFLKNKFTYFSDRFIFFVEPEDKILKELIALIQEWQNAYSLKHSYKISKDFKSYIHSLENLENLLWLGNFFSFLFPFPESFISDHNKQGELVFLKKLQQHSCFLLENGAYTFKVFSRLWNKSYQSFYVEGPAA